MTEEKIPGAGLLVWRHNKLLTYTYRYRSTLSDSDGDVRISPSRTKTKGNHHHWHSGHYVTNLSMLHRTLLRTFRSDSTSVKLWMVMLLMAGGPGAAAFQCVDHPTRSQCCATVTVAAVGGQSEIRLK